MIKQTSLFHFLLIISLTSFAAGGYAQTDYSNSLILSANNFFYPKLNPYRFGIDRNVAGEFSLYYERKIYKNLRISASYVVWNNFLAKAIYPVGPLVKGSEHGSSAPGALEWREGYKMIDVMAIYKYDKFKKHKFSFGSGISYCWGVNTYIDTVYYNPAPPYDAYIISKLKNGNYFGAASIIKYDYACFKNRINIGYDIKFRKYFGLKSVEIAYGPHVALNF